VGGFVREKLAENEIQGIAKHHSGWFKKWLETKGEWFAPLIPR
jgi:hypothetical protein